MIPATHTTSRGLAKGFVQPDRLFLMRIVLNAATSAFPCTSRAQRPAGAGAHNLSVGIGDCGKPPECFDDFLIGDLAKIEVIEANRAKGFVVFKAHDVIGLLA